MLLPFITLSLDDLYLIDGDSNVWLSVLHFSLSIVLNESFFIPVAFMALSNAPWPPLLISS